MTVRLDEQPCYASGSTNSKRATVAVMLSNGLFRFRMTVLRGVGDAGMKKPRTTSLGSQALRKDNYNLSGLHCERKTTEVLRPNGATT